MKDIKCASTSLTFRVVPGTPMPTFTMSFSLSSSTYNTTSEHGLTLTQTTTSRAHEPVRLALVDSTHKENGFGKLSMEWSYNSFPNMFSFWMDSRDVLNPDKEHIWRSREIFRAPSATDIIPGPYRRELRIPGQISDPFPAAFHPSSVPQRRSRLNPEGKNLQLQEIVLCPGDQSVQRYDIGKDFLQTLVPPRRYKLEFTYHRCWYWAFVPNTEVVQMSRHAETPWPDHTGPIRFEPVSEVARTLENILEGLRPDPFCRLPYELRKEVYAYLRYRKGASFIRFRTTE